MKQLDTGRNLFNKPSQLPVHDLDKRCRKWILAAWVLVGIRIRPFIWQVISASRPCFDQEMPNWKCLLDFHILWWTFSHYSVRFVELLQCVQLRMPVQLIIDLSKDGRRAGYLTVPIWLQISAQYDWFSKPKKQISLLTVQHHLRNKRTLLPDEQPCGTYLSLIWRIRQQKPLFFCQRLNWLIPYLWTTWNTNWPLSAVCHQQKLTVNFRKLLRLRIFEKLSEQPQKWY